MDIILRLLIGFVALMHVIILIVEMFLWDTPIVQSRFKHLPPEKLNSILAKNQGLYNGFIAAGLIWGLFMAQTFPQVEPSWIWTFFLGCITVAGIYGSITLKTPTVIMVQSIPAGLALFLLWLSHS